MIGHRCLILRVSKTEYDNHVVSREWTETRIVKHTIGLPKACALALSEIGTFGILLYLLPEV